MGFDELRRCGFLFIFMAFIITHVIHEYVNSSIMVPPSEKLQDERIYRLPCPGEPLEDPSCRLHPRVLYSGNNKGMLVEIWQFVPFPERIRINEASSCLLQTLPGVGEKRAVRIIEYRDEAGIFRSVNDLLQVPSINSTLLARIIPYITTDTSP